MKLQSRNLVFGTQGNDVRELQRELVWLGFDSMSDEISGGRVGDATRAAVKDLQRQNSLIADGVIGPKTVAVINAQLAGLKRNVRGNVLNANGKPVVKAVVRLFDKELRTEIQLGETLTDPEGYFEIPYKTSNKSTAAPNLIVKAFASPGDARPIAVSSVVFAADPEVIINLVAGEGEYRGPSDFERLMKDIRPVVDAQHLKIGQLVENKNTQDISFLSKQIGNTEDRVAHAVVAHRHAEESGLEPEIFYAFSRQGLPTEIAALLSQDSNILRRALTQAVSDNIIPPGFETEAKLTATLESFKALRAKVALKTPLGNLVKSVVPQEPLQQRFMSIYADHSGPIEDFWKKVEQDAQLGDSAAELKFAVVLGNIGQNHPPLVQAVRNTTGLKELKDLAALNTDHWQALLNEHQVDVPAGVEGANDQEKKRNYARSLARAVEAALPNEFFAARLEETVVNGKKELLAFFQANPAFDIKDTRVTSFLKTNPNALDSLEDKTAAVKQLKAMQRVYRVVSKAEPALSLLEAGIDSAGSIGRMGRNDFVARFGRHFDDAKQAQQAYAEAGHVSAAAVAILGDVNPAMDRVSLSVVPDRVASTVAEIPNWSTLFGSLDFCSCGQCQSVHSPAAYLVDILNFLKDRPAKSPASVPSVKDILFTRRPDLADVELTCENTNTAMPYVDLVLEVLEDAVAAPLSFTPFPLDSNRIAELDEAQVSNELKASFPPDALDNATIRVKRQGESWVIDALDFSYGVRRQPSGNVEVETRSRQTSGTPKERAANPQYVNRKAYEDLKKAVFPWTLPFDQPLEETRAYLAHLGVPRHQIVEAFVSGDRKTVLGNRDLAAEYLGLSNHEVELVTGPDPTEPWLQWGFEVEGQWLETIAKVDEFLRRTGLEYKQLLDLLQTRYVKKSGGVTVDSTDADHPDTCDTSKLQLRDLNVALANRIVRFVRLWRKLGWTIFDLDRALFAFDSELTADSLVHLSHLLRLRKRFNLPVPRLAAFWADIDTFRYANEGDADKPLLPSLYDQLFRSRANLNPLDATFTEDPKNLSGTLSNHIDAIAAALKVDAADLDAMIQSSEIFIAGADKALTLPNLSLLYRHVTLARALRLHVDDYLKSLALIDVAPFVDGDTTKTMLFVESVIQLKESEFDFDELDYLLRQTGDAGNGIALEDSVIVENLQDLGQELVKGAQKEAIARKLAEIFSFEISTVSVLEDQWDSLISDPTFIDAIKKFLARLVNAALPEPTSLSSANFPAQFESLTRLHKISVVATRFNIGSEMLDWLLVNGNTLGLFDLKTFPTDATSFAFPRWLRLINLLSLRTVFARGEIGLLELLEFAHQSPSPTGNDLLNLVVEQTNWNRTDLDLLVDVFGVNLPQDFRNEKALQRLRDAFDLQKRLGISALQARNLSRSEATPLMAQTVRQAVHAKYEDAQWLTIAKPLRDVLREKQRSALVDYLVAQGAHADTNDLYAHFLIDVEMAPCMMTSRIKQAVSSVQLFVQRCLMNLETEVLASAENDDAWEWWKWMKNYRVWEANRKVFLYPENWIEPELRDDKSSFFRALESELMESDLTVDTAETAFLNYVEKLDQVARLVVVGVCHQKEDELDIVHVFARTHAAPHVYYYRQRVNTAYWTPWEKVDLDIEGNHLIPVFWNGRLFLFWPMFVEKADSPKIKVPVLAKGGALTDQTGKFWEVNLAWSERKHDKWTGKKVSTRSAVIRQQTFPTPVETRPSKLARLSSVFFLPEIQGNDLVINQAFVTTEVDTSPVGSLRRIKDGVDSDDRESHDPPDDDGDDHDPGGPEYLVASQNEFRFGGCNFDPQITALGDSVIGTGQDVVSGTQRSRMVFIEKPETGLNLPVRTDLNNSQSVLARTPGLFRVVTQGADPRVTRNPFFFRDPSRSYLVTPIRSLLPDISIDPNEVGVATDRLLSLSPGNGAGVGPNVNAADSSPFTRRPNTKYNFQTFYHPYVCPLVSILNRQGLDQMLRREVQLDPLRFLPTDAAGPPFDFNDVYGPSSTLVAQPRPAEEMDFSFSGSYASYNWELFFHAPLLIADRLTKNQRFEEATKWFHYIFNPTDTSSEPAPQRYWQTREFFQKSSEKYQQDRLDDLFSLLARATQLRRRSDLAPAEQNELQRVIDLEASIKAWREYPFNPHLVARMRTTAYQKTVVMKYIDNLIAWGDQLFRRDTLESLNEATQLYVLAADILGPRPVEVPARVTPRVQTYRSLEPQLDQFSNGLVEIEDLVPAASDPSPGDPQQQPPSMLYFCLPKNDKLLGYWDTVADRLFKLRHCMNIEGVVRQLPLFEPPIDPALLVRGAAAGLDLNSLLTEFDTPLPGYRFNVLSQKASELCGELKSLGAMLLATLEKRDAEHLSLIRAKHERGLLEMIEQVRENQLQEAQASVVALQKSREVVVARYLHYQTLLGVESPEVPAVDQVIPEISASPLAKISVANGLKRIDHETSELASLEAATKARGKAASASFVATHFAQIPDTSSEPMGVGVVFALRTLPNELAINFGAEAEQSSYKAGLSSRNAQFVMRAHEWTLQNNQAAREIMQIDKQVIAAEIRREIAEHELRNHRKQMKNALEVEEFMRDKYTNRELYSWMLGQMSGVYFQAYQMAYETAKRAEKCYGHELGLTDSNFIKFGYWDSLKKGLMAGEKLHHDLKRMELAYLEFNEREYELTKHVSLVSLDPREFIKLKETGTCSFSIPEWLFDLDTPGHFMRRLKMVSLTIPCVTGPYTSIHCKLQLMKNSYRKFRPDVDQAKPYERADPSSEDRFVDNLNVVQQTVTSTAQSDSGLFEPNMRDERYLPFEGAGAISTWELTLPTEFKAFDYSTISDVILHMRYTAKDGGEALRSAASDSARRLLEEPPADSESRGLVRLFSLRHEFPSEWHRFVSSPRSGNNVLTVDLAQTRLPYFVQGRDISIDKATALEKSSSSLPKIAITPGETKTPTLDTSVVSEFHGLAESRPSRGRPGFWTFGTDSDPKTIADIFVIFEYTVS